MQFRLLILPHFFAPRNPQDDTHKPHGGSRRVRSAPGWLQRAPRDGQERSSGDSTERLTNICFPSYASSLPCLHCLFTSASLQRACMDSERVTTQALFGIILRNLEAICERSWASLRTFRPTFGAVLKYLRVAVGCFSRLSCHVLGALSPFRARL